MEQILYDTSSLINAYKQRKQLTGYTTILNVVEFPKLLELKLTVIYPSKSEYNLAIKLSKDLIRTFGIIQLEHDENQRLKSAIKP
jgi:hypothetical protein